MISALLLALTLQVQDSVLVISRPLPPVTVTVPPPVVNVTVAQDTLMAQAIARVEQGLAVALERCECNGSGHPWWWYTGTLLIGAGAVYYLREIAKGDDDTDDWPEHEHEVPKHEHPKPEDGHGRQGKGRGHHGHD